MAAMKSAQMNGVTRSLMRQQPARILLIDISNPIDHGSGNALCDALEKVLCISANMAGLSRMPLLSIYVLASYPEIILPLSCTKDNFVRLHSALSNIRTFFNNSSAQGQSRENETCITQGIVEACEQYKRYVANLTQAIKNFSQMELFIFTGHSGELVQKQMSAVADHIDLNVIKRIVCATLTCSLTSADSLPSPDDAMVDPVDNQLSGLVDVLTLDCDDVTLQKFFYSWLTDTSSESEHLHILLPPANSDDDILTVKCDITERMIPPTQLPFSDAYNLHSESNACRHIFPTPSKVQGMSVPIHQLKVLFSIPRYCLCESILYGLPLVAVPTACWKIDWDLLEQNQQNFLSLCHELMKKDQVLLMQLVNLRQQHDNIRQRTPTKTAAINIPPPKPSGYFVLMPCDQRSFLVKSVLSREFILPSNSAIISGLPTQASDFRIQASLSQVEIQESFNPLNFDSGLYAALKHNSLPKLTLDTARTNKRKAELLESLTKNKRGGGRWNAFASPETISPLLGGHLTATHSSHPLGISAGKANSSAPYSHKNRL